MIEKYRKNVSLLQWSSLKIILKARLGVVKIGLATKLHRLTNIIKYIFCLIGLSESVSILTCGLSNHCQHCFQILVKLEF